MLYERLTLILVLLLLSAVAVAGVDTAHTKLSVHTDFEGGSASHIRIDQEDQVIRLRPGGDPDRGWPNWWYFRVEGIEPGTVLTVVLDASHMKLANGSSHRAAYAMPTRATFSIDQYTWRLTAPGKRDGGTITYHQKIEARRAWFAWGPPFTATDAADLVQKLARRCDGAEAFTLATSRHGRPVPALRVACGDKPMENRPVVWVQARQHTWESGSSWVGRGFAQWLMGDDPAARWLRQSAEIIFVPVMDVDNVATGNGGKEQLPHDHNRDWSSDPYFPAVRAAQQRLREYDEAGRLRLFIDLHNPGPKGDHANFFVPPYNRMSANRRRAYERFLAACARSMIGPIPFRREPHQTGSDYDEHWKHMSATWVMLHTSEHVIALTLETPWNTPHSTTAGYMTIGRQLGLAIADYLPTGE